MPVLVAKKKDNLIYSIEKDRLSQHILKQLGILKASPTRNKLNAFQSAVQVLLTRSTKRVVNNAYIEGAKTVDHLTDVSIGLRLDKDAVLRASQAAVWIADTTGIALDIKAGMSKDKALSAGRADKIAVNELSLAFFNGTRYGWGLDLRARKSWIVSDAHDKDDICDDNEDEGPIEINEAFQSGDFIPPAHINCECELGLTRVKR